MHWLKRVMRWLLATLFVVAGVLHFCITDFYVKIMPPYLPWHEELVYVSGVCEFALGVGLLIPGVSRWAAWGLIALLVAVFPARTTTCSPVALVQMLGDTLMVLPSARAAENMCPGRERYSCPSGSGFPGANPP